MNNILLFEGEYLNGKRWNGNGKEYHRNFEIKFEGKYLNGKRLIEKGKEYEEYLSEESDDSKSLD